MAKKKFAKKEFRRWLDTLAAVVVKTRDGFSCQFRMADDCQGSMMPGDFNCQWCHIKSKGTVGNSLRWDLLNALTGCGQCHAYIHGNPDVFGVWFERECHAQYLWLNSPHELKTWREDDYRAVEVVLLEKANDLGVDWLNFPVYFQKKAKRRMSEVMFED